MDSRNKEIKFQTSKLLNTNQNKRLISIKIEEFFNKSKLKSIESSYEEKVSNMKNLLYSFHFLYNSLNHYKSLIDKENENIKKYIISSKDKNPNELVFYVIKKKSVTNRKINKNVKTIKKAEEKFEKINKEIKTMKSYINKIKNDNDILINEKILKTEQSINIFEDKIKIKKIGGRKELENNKKKLYNLIPNNKIQKTREEIYDNNSKFYLNKYKKFINEENNNNNYKNIMTISDSNKKYIKINSSANITKLKNIKNNFSSKNRLRDKYKKRNFKSLNKISLSLNIALEHKNYHSNRRKIKIRLNMAKEEEITHKVSKSYKFEHRYTFQNKYKYINNIDNKL